MTQLKIGGFYATPKNGGYQISRALYFDEDIVHLSYYSNLYQEIPEKINPEELTFSMMTIREKEDGTIECLPYESQEKGKMTLGSMFKQIRQADSMGIMHFPMELEGFLKDSPVLIEVGSLEHKDLYGFETFLAGMGLTTEVVVAFLSKSMIVSMSNLVEQERERRIPNGPEGE